MRLVWRHEKHDKNNQATVALDVYKADTSAQLIKHQQCSPYKPSEAYTIKTGSFRYDALTIKVDEKTSSYSGTITFAGQKYSLSEDGETNHGTSCYRMYSDTSVFIDCLIPLPASFAEKPYPLSSDHEDCLFDTPADEILLLAKDPKKSL